jgi:MoxR-like ATPase
MAIPKVTHTQLVDIIRLSWLTRQPLLIVGSPGIGKTESAKDFAKSEGIKLQIDNPGISDPTDYKGLPGKAKRIKKSTDPLDELDLLGDDDAPQEEIDIATFLPFGTLLNMIEADEPTLWAWDDMGQAPPSVQVSLMPILSEGQIGEHHISPNVHIIATTNGREHKAGVKGLLEPVKSRFGMIVELVPDLESFSTWGYDNGIDHTIIDYLNYHPEDLCKFEANLGMENSPNPRLWWKLSQQLDGLRRMDTEGWYSPVC